MLVLWIYIWAKVSCNKNDMFDIFNQNDNLEKYNRSKSTLLKPVTVLELLCYHIYLTIRSPTKGKHTNVLLEHFEVTEKEHFVLVAKLLLNVYEYF